MSWSLTACDSPCPCPHSGYVFVDLSSEEEVKKALKCNREYMGKGVSGVREGRPCAEIQQEVHSPAPWSSHRANTQSHGSVGG